MNDEADFRLDFRRTGRLGFSEAIFCEGKTAGQVDRIIEAGRERGASMLLTRLDARKVGELDDRNRAALDFEPSSRTAFLGAPARPAGVPSVAIVTAGTSDVPVAREALRTLEFMGLAGTMIVDVGVAGLWRLTERAEEIAAHPVVVCVAGWDAALPSVVGGLVPGLVIAVPTSTGYGAARGGETALASALTSCAPGVLVCNIDNGYGAACAAFRALHAGRFRRSSNPADNRGVRPE